MSGWSRTVKPSADTTISAGDIYGVDGTEIKVTDGVAHVGWVRRKTVGSRVLHETLVAMKTPPTEDNADDTVFPDTVITITTQPENSEETTGTATSFAVAAVASPTATLSYQWQVDTGSGFGNITEAGVYTDVTEATLLISDNTGLDGNLYRCVIEGVDTGASVTSSSATLTEL